MKLYKKKAIIFGILGIILSFSFSMIFFINSYGIPTETLQVKADENLSVGKSNLIHEEELLEPSKNRDDIEWLPIDQTLDFSTQNTQTGINNLETVAFDPKTGVQIIESPENGLNIDSSIVEEYRGLLNYPTPEDVIIPDDRTYISTTEAFPWNTICKLYITAPDASTYWGTGFIVDSFHVLTAGHCAYIHGHGGWATEIEVVPGKDGIWDPYGHAYMTYMRSYAGWTVSQMPEHDWAMLTLDRNVGSYTGWMGRMTAASSDAIYSSGANSAGYPGDLGGGEYMYYDYDGGDGATEYNHYYWMDTAGGQSGMPIWRISGSSRYVLTIHAYGRGGTLSNYGTRFNTDKFNRIFTWLASDTSPTDKPDMKDRGSSYSGYNTGIITRGQTSFSVWSDIRNVGTAYTGGFYVYYYASTNTFISEFDYLIGIDYVPSISPFSYGDSMWSGTFPASIPAGNYYVGWIIDRNGYIDEFDETDNTAYISSQITVSDPPVPPPTGYIEVTVEDYITTNPIQYALVICKNATDDIVASGVTNSSGFYNITGLDIGWYDVYVSKVGYYPQVIQNYIDWNGDDDYLYFAMNPMPPDSGYVEVRVYDSVTNNPIEYAYVRCYNWSSGELFNEGYTDHSGFYNVTGLYIGLWTINVTYPGFYEKSYSDYINWNGDDDYLYFYLDSIYNPILGPVAIFQDRYPWNNNDTEPILTKYNVTYDLFDSLDFSSVDLSLYDKVIISSDQTQEFYDRLAGNVSWFEDYAFNGGILQVSACDQGWGFGVWNDSYLLPGGLNKTNSYLENVSINIPYHPVLLNPYLVEDDGLDDWFYSAHGYFHSYPAHAKEILLDVASSNPVLLELEHGSGYIISYTQTLEWNANFNYTKLLENVVMYNPTSYDYSNNIMTPDTDSIWEVYGSYHITWDPSPNINNVKIELFQGGISVYQIVESTPNDGDFLWVIPEGLTDSTQYQIKLIDLDYFDNVDTSDYFEIFTPSITVIVPGSTSLWTKGLSYDINWTSIGAISNVKIELYDESQFVMEISASEANDGLFTWAIPAELDVSNQYRIKIIDILHPNVYDYSDYFEIISPSESDGIPGYNPFILTGLISLISLVLIRKKFKN
ncbi:MAG: carboxypeptidase regulatory-like domain-containing protein [Candidatus Thorarchaeota archaeon]